MSISSESRQDPLTGISSMATTAILASLVKEFEERSACPVRIESVGGVLAAQRIQDGETFDFAILADNVIDRLIQAGCLLAGSRVNLVRSPVAAAVRIGSPHPDLSSEAAVRAAVIAATSVGYSTGPSGKHLAQLFERWGISTQIEDRIVLAPPGVPVGTLIAQGAIELGFQQLSELQDVEGIDVLGVLPPDCAFITTFSAGICASTPHADAVRRMLEFMNSPEMAVTKRRHGMEPAG